MKYRLTPLHFFAGYYLYRSLYYFIVLDMDNAGLGGFFPFILGGISIGLFVIDSIIQVTFYWSPKLLYAIESLLAIGILYLYFSGFGFMDL